MSRQPGSGRLFAPDVRVADAFARRMREVHGAAGGAWLARLPLIVADLARRWSLRVHAPFAPLTYNYVAPAVGVDGTRLVLKVGVPNRELLTEIEALRHFDGEGAVHLHAADRQVGALLLERI